MNTLRKYISDIYVKNNQTGRNISLRDSDVFLVSYPKSGGIWLRFLLANILTDKVITSSDIDKVIPSIYSQSEQLLVKIKGKRYLSSNEYFDPRYNHTLYLVRDPRCIVLSEYVEKIRSNVIDKKYPLSDFVKDFVSGRTSIVGTWSEHVESWHHLKWSTQKDFLLIRYEDLVDNFRHVLSKICTFLGINYNNDLIESARSRSLFSGHLDVSERKTDCFNLEYPIGKDNPSCNGECWQYKLADKDIRTIERHFGETMQKAGYSSKFDKS